MGRPAGILGCFIKDIESFEPLGVGVLQLRQLLLQEDVRLGDVSKDQSDLSLIFGVVEDRAHDLVHGRDSSAAGNHRDVVVLVGRPLVLRQRTLKRQRLVDVHVMEVSRHGAFLVLLHEEIKVPSLGLIRNGGVRPDGRLRIVGALVLREQARGDFETCNVILCRQLEPELLGVVIDLLDLCEFEINPGAVVDECGDGRGGRLRDGCAARVVEIVAGASTSGKYEGVEECVGLLLFGGGDGVGARALMNVSTPLSPLNGKVNSPA